jgi:hypothetical protein
LIGTHKIQIDFKPKISKENEKFIFKKFEVDSFTKEGIKDLKNYLKIILLKIFYNEKRKNLNILNQFSNLILKPNC